MSTENVLALVDYSNLYSEELQQQLNKAKEQTFNAEWHAKSAGTATEFVVLTIIAAKARLTYMEVVRYGLTEASQNGKLPKPKLSEAMHRAKKAIAFTKMELRVLGRRRKFMTEDLDDQYKADRSMAFWSPALWHSCTLASAYLKLRDRIFVTDFPLLEMDWSKRALRSKFREDLLVYNGSSKVSLLDRMMHYCHLSGKWCPPSRIKAVHIVPKVLESEALSYLFGVEEVNLSDPRNGMLSYSGVA
jgi:hypothetical protein